MRGKRKRRPLIHTFLGFSALQAWAWAGSSRLLPAQAQADRKPGGFKASSQPHRRWGEASLQACLQVSVASLQKAELFESKPHERYISVWVWGSLLPSVDAQVCASVHPLASTYTCAPTWTRVSLLTCGQVCAHVCAINNRAVYSTRGIFNNIIDNPDYEHECEWCGGDDERKCGNLLPIDLDIHHLPINHTQDPVQVKQ